MRATAPSPCLDRRTAAGLAAWWIAAAPLAHGAVGQEARSADALDPVVVGLVLNGTVVADAQLVHRQPLSRPALIWLPLERAGAWRIDTAGRALRTIEGVPHVAVCDRRDRCFYDDSTALLDLTLQAQDLRPLAIEPSRQSAATLSDPEATGGWLNYDVSAWHVGRPGLALQLEGRSYTAYGHGAVRLDGLYSAGRGRRSALAALWQVDRPDEGWSAQFGSVGIADTVFSANLPLRGVHLGSNARLQPLLPTTLRPFVLLPAGERALRADVFVDGQYRQTAEVAYGPYSVEVQPTQPGRGQIDIVSTDATGLQTRSSLPFYQAPQLLAPGVTEWSLDAGWLHDAPGRQGPRLGVLSAGLGRALDRMATLHLQALAARGALRVAAAVDAVHPLWGLSSVSLVAQRSRELPQGQAWVGLGQEFLSRTGSLSLRAERGVQGCVRDSTGGGSAESGLAERLARPCQRVAATVGADIDARWSVSGAAHSLRDMQGRRSALAHLGARLQTGANSQLSLSLQQLRVGAVSSRQVLLNWTLPLSPQWQAQVGAQRRSGRVDGQGAGVGAGAEASAQWSLQSVAAAGEPTLERTQIHGSTGAQAELGVRHAARAELADWRAEGQADARGASASVRLSAGVSGALGYGAGRLFATRRIDDAFVLVDVGLPGLPVLLDNREVARTNAAGWAVVSEARAHQANVVGVDTSALPIEYAMPRDQQTVVPGSAAGVLARFDLSDGGVALVVRDEAGQRLPAGSSVQVSSQRLPTAVTSRGEVFVDRSDRAADIGIRWGTRACRFRYEPKAALAVHECVAA